MMQEVAIKAQELEEQVEAITTKVDTLKKVLEEKTSKDDVRKLLSDKVSREDLEQLIPNEDILQEKMKYLIRDELDAI